MPEPSPLLCKPMLIVTYIATGVRALLALAGEACTPAISNFYASSQAPSRERYKVFPDASSRINKKSYAGSQAPAWELAHLANA